MNELQWTNETDFFIKIYLSHFILEVGTQFVASLRDWWRDIYLERGLLLASCLLSGARGCQRLHPFASRIARDVRDASDRLPLSVIYWPSTEPSIKRCTCVNKRKNSGSRWELENNITRCLGISSQLETGCGSENQLQTEGFRPLVTPVEQPKPRCDRSTAMVEKELGTI